MNRAFRILLIQARESQPERAYELESFSLATGLPQRCFHPLNAILNHLPPQRVNAFQGVIIAGSPFSATDQREGFIKLKPVLNEARKRRIPIFGICFGAQLLAHHFGGRVQVAGDCAEHGTKSVRKTPHKQQHPLFAPLPPTFKVQQWHDDHIVKLPSGATLLAEGDDCLIQAFSMDHGLTVATQYHPEHTPGWLDWVLAQGTGNLSPEKLAAYRRYREMMRLTPRAHGMFRRFVEQLQDNFHSLSLAKSRPLGLLFLLLDFFRRAQRIRRCRYSRLHLHLH